MNHFVAFLSAAGMSYLVWVVSASVTGTRRRLRLMLAALPWLIVAILAFRSSPPQTVQKLFLLGYGLLFGVWGYLDAVRRGQVGRLFGWPAAIGVLLVGLFGRYSVHSWKVHEPLERDAATYVAGGSLSANPWQARDHSGLWYAAAGWTIRLGAAPESSVRINSLVMSLVAVVAIYGLVSRWFDPLIGLITAAMYAVDPLMVMQAGRGLRIDAYVALSAGVLYFAYVCPWETRRRYLGLGVVGGLTLMLRWVAWVPLLAVWLHLLCSAPRSWRGPAAALLLWVAAVLPGLVVQHRVHGDALYLSHRNVRYFGRGELSDNQVTRHRAEFAAKVEAEEPVSPWQFIVRYHRPQDVARALGRGLWRIGAGLRFGRDRETWWRVLCALGLVWLVLDRRRGLVVWWLFSIFPAQSYLVGQHALDDRIVLHAWWAWSLAGVWVVLFVLRRLPETMTRLGDRHAPA